MERLVLFSAVCFVIYFVANWQSSKRRKRFDRGRRLGRTPRQTNRNCALRWGPVWIPKSQASQHFLAVGTTGSGKSLVQRLLMRDALIEIGPGNDHRALILDAKNDTVPFLRQIGCTSPVYTLNPFDGRTDSPTPVAWDIAADITSPSRALNLSAALIPDEKGGSNRYFTDAARMVVSGVIESFIRNSPGSWSFSDLVFATLSMERTRKVLERDSIGQDVLSNFLGDERTAYQVFTTVVSRMAYYRSIAGLWQKTNARLSLRAWLEDDSILLLGVNTTARAAMDAINDIVFRVIVEEIDTQSDCSKRRTWVWIDEARLSGPLLRGEMLPFLAVKGRSRGACLVLAFQDIEGFREAAGARVAHEIIAQCSHKALLRLESEESSSWASKLLGQYEALELMRSSPTNRLTAGSKTEHVNRRDTVLPSEFYMIPMTNKTNGLTGYFLTPNYGAIRGFVCPDQLQPIVADEQRARAYRFVSRAEDEQILRAWVDTDHHRLTLDRVVPTEPAKPRLKLKRGSELSAAGVQ